MYRIVRIYKEKEKPMWDLAINGVDFYHIANWFYIYSFLFLLGSTLLGYFVLKFLSKSKEDNLGFWFLFVLTLKTILFYFFLYYCKSNTLFLSCRW